MVLSRRLAKKDDKSSQYVSASRRIRCSSSRPRRSRVFQSVRLAHSVLFIFPRYNAPRWPSSFTSFTQRMSYRSSLIIPLRSILQHLARGWEKKIIGKRWSLRTIRLFRRTKYPRETAGEGTGCKNEILIVPDLFARVIAGSCVCLPSWNN